MSFIRGIIRNPGYDIDAQRVIQAMTTPPPGRLAQAMSQLVKDLKRGLVWEKLDVLQVFAVHNSADALINWKNPGTSNASLVNSPTFVVNRGFTGDGVSAYVNTNYNPATFSGAKWAQNDAQAYTFTTLASPDTASATNSILGVDSVTQEVLIRPWSAGGGNWVSTINGLTNTTAAVTPTASLASRLGGRHILRTGASATRHRVNGGQSVSGSVASTTVLSANLVLLVDTTTAGNYSTDTIGLFMAGASFSATSPYAPEAAQDRAVRRFMLSIGVTGKSL